MDVRNCKGCGRLFNYIGGKPLCQECIKGLEDKFQQVKNYLREHTHAGIQEVAEENDVDVRQIKQWIREERLTFAKDSPITIDCESCGAPIRSGRFCAACVAKMQTNLGSAINRPKPVEPKKNVRDKDRMRFLDKF